MPHSPDIFAQRQEPAPNSLVRLWAEHGTTVQALRSLDEYASGRPYTEDERSFIATQERKLDAIMAAITASLGRSQPAEAARSLIAGEAREVVLHLAEAEGRDLSTPSAFITAGAVADDDEALAAMYATMAQTITVARAGALTDITARGDAIGTAFIDAAGRPVATRVAEATAIPVSDPTFQGRRRKTAKYATLLKGSREWEEDARASVPFLLGLLGEAIGTASGVDFLLGTGTDQPEGLASGATVGATTTGATITANDLWALHDAVPARYRETPGAAWVMGTAAASAARKLAIYDVATRTLAGFPIFEDSALPAVATGNRPVVFGSIREAYRVRLAAEVRLDRSDEASAVADTDKFLLRAVARMDGHYLDKAAAKALVIG